MKIKSIFIFLITALSAVAVYASQESGADEKSYYGDEIIISGTGYEKTLTSTPGGIGVMSGDKIMKQNPVSITDALQDITGVYKSSDSAWGSEISVRGAGRDKVIMIIDGSRMNTSTDIGAQFGTINPASIEKVEVLKGPISSLYGSGSIGGVINIFTRTGRFIDDPKFEGGLNTGYESNSNGINTYGFTSYNSSNFYLFGSGSWRKHDDYKDGNNNKVDNSGFNDAEGTVNIGFIPVSGHSIEIRTQYYEGWDIGIPGARDSVPLTASDAEYRKIERGLLSADYRITPVTPVWTESKLHLYFMSIKREVCIVNSPLKIEPESDSRTAGIQWTNTMQWGNNKLVAGIDSWLRTISTDRTKTNITTGALVTEDTPIPDAYYYSGGIFFEDDIKLAAFTLNVGGRYDLIYTGNETVYKSEYPASSVVIWDKQNARDFSWNGHAGLSYEILRDFTTGILAASGYRAASLEEKYKYIALGSVTHWGNPDLEPERSLFFEYTLHYKNRLLKTNGSCYLNELRNLIAEKQQTSTEYRLENINKARIWGAEYDVSVKPVNRFEVYNNLSYTRGRDTKNNQDLASIAPLRVITGLRINDGYMISGYLDCTWTAAQTHVPDGMEKSESWYRFDAGLNIRFSAGGFDHKIFLICTNLFNYNYYDYLSVSKTGYKFDEPGRSVKCGYSVLF